MLYIAFGTNGSLKCQSVSNWTVRRLRSYQTPTISTKAIISEGPHSSLPVVHRFLALHFDRIAAARLVIRQIDQICFHVDHLSIRLLDASLYLHDLFLGVFIGVSPVHGRSLLTPYSN